MKHCKYLERLGFHAFEFGTRPNGNVDVSAGDDNVCDNVSPEAQKQISEFLRRLEERVMNYIEVHYE